MPFETVLVEKEGKVAWLTLNRPAKLNAINDALLRDLEAALKELQRDDNIWVVVLRGAGRAFSAGQDLSGVGTAEVVPPDPRTKPHLSDLFEAAQDSYARWRAIFHYPRFTIAQVHGYCLGLGCQLAMCCKALIAAEDAVFGDPSVRMGWASPNPLWTWRVGLKKAKELLLTGRYIDGREAERIGLALKAVPPRELEEVVREEVEAQLRYGGIGGYDMQVGWRIALETNLDVTGLAAGWRYASYLYALSAIQRPGRSFMDRGGLDFGGIRERQGLKAALEARDAPLRPYFPPPPPPQES